MSRPNRDTVSALVLLCGCGAFFWASTRIRDMGFETLGFAGRNESGGNGYGSVLFLPECRGRVVGHLDDL